jgi:endonuclease-3
VTGRPRRIQWGRTIEALSGWLSARPSGAPLPSVSEVARRKRDPFHVLVSTMISLRTKDDVTARSAERLLNAAPDPRSLAALPESRIARLIYPAGFYRVKARNIRAAARIILQSHGGKVPRRMAELLGLPGVGRKTANLVLTLGFGLPGICVDTHVHRISNRLGWVETKSPDRTEQALRESLPRRHWIGINEVLVRFGQTVCTPLSPRCSTCPVGRLCPRVGVGRSR